MNVGDIGPVLGQHRANIYRLRGYQRRFSIDNVYQSIHHGQIEHNIPDRWRRYQNNQYYMILTILTILTLLPRAGVLTHAWDVTDSLTPAAEN